MAVSASTLKPVFNIGEFSVTTSLTIPSDDLSDALSFSLPSPIYPQLPNLEYSTTPVVPSVWTLARLTYNGTEVFKNAQFDSPPAAAPTAPQSIISVSGAGGVDELYQDANPIPLVKDSNGNVASGTYVLTLIYIYQDDNLDWYADTIVYPSVNLNVTSKEPNLEFAYNTFAANPFLRLTDSTDYTIGSTSPSTSMEFILYPPRNRSAVTTILSDVQELEFTRYFTGGNEFQMYGLISYDFSTFEVVYLVSSYETFTIYFVDSCSIFNCLNDLYERYTSASCGTKSKAVTEKNMVLANSLAMQLLSGQGCTEETLTDVLNDFNALCGCNCDCLDDSPRLIEKALLAVTSQTQTITATTATTVIDLAEGNKIYIELDADTEISVTNQAVNEKYTIIITSYDGFSATFSDDFSWGHGWEIIATPSDNPFGFSVYYFEETDSTLVSMIPVGIPEPLNDGQSNVLREEAGVVFWDSFGVGDFMSVGDDVSLLTNDANYVSLEDIASTSDFLGVGTTFTLDLSLTNANVFNLSSSASSLTISLESNVDLDPGRSYAFTILNSGATDMTVSFNQSDFVDNYAGSISTTVAVGGVKLISFFASQPPGAAENVLVLSSIASNYLEEGANISLLTNDSNYVSSGDNVSLLDNDAGYITSPFVYSDMGAISGFYSIDFSNDGDIQKFDANGDISFAAQGIVEGKKYTVIIKNNSNANNVSVSFTSSSFIKTPSIIVPRLTDSYVSFDFMCIFADGVNRLIPSSQDVSKVFSSVHPTPVVTSDASISLDVSVTPSYIASLTGATATHTFSLANPKPFGEYSLILSNDGTVTKNIDFLSPLVFDINGENPSIAIEQDSKVIISIQSTDDDGDAIIKSVTPNTASSGSFVAVGDNISLLTNDEGYISTPFVYENVGAQGNYAADLSDKDIVYLQVTSAGSTLSATNIVEGRKYTFVIRNTDTTGNSYIFFNGSTFENSPSVTIPAFINESLVPSVYAFEFVAVNTGTLVRLVPSTTNLPSIARGYEITVPSGTWILDASTTKELQLNIDEDLTLNINKARAFEFYTIILYNEGVVSVDFDFGTPSSFVPTIHDGAGASPTYTLAPEEYIVLGIQMTANDNIGVIAYKTPNGTY